MLQHTEIEIKAKTCEAVAWSLSVLLEGLGVTELDPGNFLQVVGFGACEDDGGYWSAQVRHYQDSARLLVQSEQQDRGIDWNAN